MSHTKTKVSSQRMPTCARGRASPEKRDNFDVISQKREGTQTVRIFALFQKTPPESATREWHIVAFSGRSRRDVRDSRATNCTTGRAKHAQSSAVAIVAKCKTRIRSSTHDDRSRLVRRLREVEHIEFTVFYTPHDVDSRIPQEFHQSLAVSPPHNPSTSAAIPCHQ